MESSAKQPAYQALIEQVRDYYRSQPDGLRWCEDCQEINLWTYWRGRAFIVELLGCPSLHGIESASNFFLSTALQIQFINELHCFGSFQMYVNAVRISVPAVAKKWGDDQPPPFFPISMPDFISDAFCVEIIHKSPEAHNQIILFVQGIRKGKYELSVETVGIEPAWLKIWRLCDKIN